MVEIEYNGIEKNKRYENIVKKAIEACFEIESLTEKNLEMNIIFTTPSEIRRINKQYRNVDKETDVLSFPMFEKNEILILREKGSTIPEVLGDIVISIEQVEKQSVEYGHSFERELAYMVVHGFYHCMGYDHMEEEEKKEMREKEENALSKIGLERN